MSLQAHILSSAFSHFNPIYPLSKQLNCCYFLVMFYTHVCVHIVYLKKYIYREPGKLYES